MQERRNFKQAAEWLLEMPAFATDNDAVAALIKKFPEMSNTDAMTAAVIMRTISEGDAKSFATIRDTTGEVPVANVNVANSEPMVINIKTI